MKELFKTLHELQVCALDNNIDFDLDAHRGGKNQIIIDIRTKYSRSGGCDIGCAFNTSISDNMQPEIQKSRISSLKKFITAIIDSTKD